MVYIVYTSGILLETSIWCVCTCYMQTYTFEDMLIHLERTEKLCAQQLSSTTNDCGSVVEYYLSSPFPMIVCFGGVRGGKKILIL